MLIKSYEGCVILHYLQVNKLACYCFNGADGRHGIPWSEKKDSLFSWHEWYPVPQAPIPTGWWDKSQMMGMHSVGCTTEEHSWAWETQTFYNGAWALLPLLQKEHYLYTIILTGKTPNLCSSRRHYLWLSAVQIALKRQSGAKGSRCLRLQDTLLTSRDPRGELFHNNIHPFCHHLRFRRIFPSVQHFSHFN